MPWVVPRCGPVMGTRLLVQRVEFPRRSLCASLMLRGPVQSQVLLVRYVVWQWIRGFAHVSARDYAGGRAIELNFSQNLQVKLLRSSVLYGVS
jgi:hypothetical protein